MRKPATLLIAVLFFSFLQIIGLSTFEVAAPSDLSNLTIVSPQNKTYNSQFLSLKVTINYELARTNSMSYIIDDLGSYLFSNHFNSEDSNVIYGTAIWVDDLPELAEGTHSITVSLEGTLYLPDERPYSEQATVYFTVENTSSHSPSPSPTATSSPSPEPTAPNSTPLPSDEPQSTEQAVILGLAVTVAVLAVGLGLLLYRIKRK